MAGVCVFGRSSENMHRPSGAHDGSADVVIEWRKKRLWILCSIVIVVVGERIVAWFEIMLIVFIYSSVTRNANVTFSNVWHITPEEPRSLRQWGERRFVQVEKFVRKNPVRRTRFGKVTTKVFTCLYSHSRHDLFRLLRIKATGVISIL